MQTNQRGEPIQETYLLPYGADKMDEDELREALALLCDHLKVSIWRTNATKSGVPELELRKDR
jgi:hypothetical protein